jgi:hypothetical protein
MASFAFDLILWLTGIRGHLPRFDDFRPAPAAPSSAVGYLARVFAVAAAAIAALSFAVWGTVWIAIHLL